MPTRPHSISELAQFAKDDSLSSSRGVKDWLRVADTLRKQGQQAIQDGDIQAGFLYLARSATYILEKIPHHPAYHDLNPTQMSNLKNNGHDILHNLEQLKPRLADLYEQWRAKDPRNATAPSELQEAYGATIAPIVISRAAKRSNSLREGLPQARAAVSQQTFHPTVSMNDLSRDLDGVNLNTSPQDRHTRVRAPEEGARRQWDAQVERAKRQDEESRALMAQEDAARRHWEMEEDIRWRQKEEQRSQAEQERAQQAKNAALNSVRQAAGMSPNDRYANQATRYRESAIASSVSPPMARHNPGYDAVPHHPLQDPLLLRNELQETTTPIWQANHTPTATRAQPLYSQHAPPIDTSFVNGSVQYPQLMSAHQRAQGYQPSVMFPSPVTSRGGSSSLYNVSLPHQTQVVQYPPPRSSSFAQPQPTYSPAPPPPSLYPSADASSPTPASHYESAPRPQRNSQPPPSQGTHRRQTSIPEVLRNANPLAMRPIDMPAELLDRFLGVARLNTLRKVETCGLLLGKERGAGFTIVTLLIPEQRGTQDTCTMESEELVVEFSTDRDLLTLGWIHTHPTQSCFMSSLDLHTHAAYQSTLKEAIAIVCAPTSEPKFGIFRLTDPPGLDTVMNCRIKEPFHPHPEHLAIYTDCDGSHVRLVTGMHLEIVDLRRGQDFSSSEGTRGI